MEDIPSWFWITFSHSCFWNTAEQSKTTWVVLGGRPFVICQLKRIHPETETQWKLNVNKQQWRSSVVMVAD